MSRPASTAVHARPPLHLVGDQTPVAPGVPEWLPDVAAELAESRELWRPRVRHDPERRFFERLVVTEEYDAWLVGWSPGQAIAAHDHGPSAGALVVTEGHLVEIRWAAGGALRTQELAAGDGDVFSAHEIHAVANLGADLATSLHVYSPPLSTMRWFDGDGDGLRVAHQEEVAVERSHAWPVADR